MSDDAPWLAFQPAAPATPTQPSAPAPQSGQPWNAYQFYGQTGAVPVGEPPIPSATSWDHDKNLIMAKESGGQNIPNYRFDPTHTAQGYFQITDTNWNVYAPKAGIDLKQHPNAMSADEKDQEKVAKQLYDEQGLKPWSESLAPKTVKAPVISAAATANSSGWNVAPEAIADEQSSGADVRWMSPRQYLDLTPIPAENATQTAKAKSLGKSLSAGENIESIPTLDVKMQGDRAVVYDQDGRNRAIAAQQAGVDLIPVAVKGVSGTPAQIQGMRGGEAIPYDFRQIGKIEKPKPSELLLSSIIKQTGRAALDAAEKTGLAFAHVGAGAAELPVGVAQLAAHGAKAVGVPGAPAVANATDTVADALSRFSNSGSMVDRGASMLGNVGASMLLPGTGMAGDAGALMKILQAVRGGGIAAAAQPITGPPGDYWAQKGIQTAEGAALGGGLGAAGAAIKGIGSLANRVVTPSTLTRAATRLFGPEGSEVTPKLLNDAKKRIVSVMNAIETGHDIKFDPTLRNDLLSTATDVHNTLGNEAKPVLRELDNVVSRAKEGSIPGKAAATLWHQGSSLDRLTESRNPDVAHFARQIQSSLRNALNRQLPPAEAATYSAARAQYRDMKIVSRAMKPQLGVGQLSPRRYVAAIAKQFPNAAETAGGPPVVELGRAAAQTWTPSAGSVVSRLGRDTIGTMVGGAAGAILGGGNPLTTLAGSAAGALAMDRLAMLRLAPRGAGPLLRPPGMTANVLSQIGQMGRLAAPGAAFGLQLQGQRQ